MYSKIEIYEKKSKIPINREFLRRLTEEIVKKEGYKKFEISLAYLNKEDLRELNKRFRNLDRTTNVLSFIYENSPILKGEIIISNYNVEKRGESFLKLYIHGLLHLLGFDHMKRKEREIMRKKEEEYFKYYEKQKSNT
ncbi:MAG: rRNA maturation RNase YbeY [Caldisericia bacterium]|jgi:probable rRNA maturation factor|nr:rRNA maturation RNase YbeY [Caldisericia bacterium]